MYRAIVVRRVRAYLDAEKVTEVCNRLAKGGVEAAGAPPITE